jgi:hypothetical protein
MSRRRPGGGWADFTAVILAIAGFLNALQGLSALYKREIFSEEALVFQNLGVWAAVWIAVGIGQIGTASLLVGREPAGRLLAIIFAAGSIVVSFFTMGAYPVWHLTVIALDVLIIFGLTTHPEAFDESVGDEDEPGRDWIHPADRPSVTPPLPR